jgi:hypothetical protein
MQHVAPSWSENWQQRVVARLRSLGCVGVVEYLARFPGEPYVSVAKSLGDDIAALQLEWLHLKEAAEKRELRQAAKDSLARDLNRYLPDGWRHGAKGDFDTSSAFAVWATRLQQCEFVLQSEANSVWDALEELKPSRGWRPVGPEDELIIQAFHKGWPEDRTIDGPAA